MENFTPKYFDLNGTHVAAIGKSGSSAISRAILFALQPNYTVRSASGNEDNVARSLNRPKWQAMVPKTESPTNPIIPVRDPVERFRSACAQEGKTADEMLTKLEAGDFNFHTKPVKTWLITNCRLYKFPEHVANIAEALGLEEIPSVNDSESNNGPKPDLTPEQLSRVQAIYSDDIALYNSIAEAGQLWTATIPEPEPQALTQADYIAIGERAVEQAGLTGPRLVTLMDLLLTVKGAGAEAAHPKLIALYAWLQTVKAMAVAGQVNFPPAPHTFEEVVTE